MIAALAATVALHASLLILPPPYLPVSVAGKSNRWEQSLMVLLPEGEDVIDRTFVVTNPDVPANPPEDARHFAARDQQAAQEEPAEVDIGTPRVDGDLPDPTQYILPGETIHPEEVEEVFAELMEPALLRPAEPATPVPGFETVEADGEGLDILVAEDEMEGAGDRPIEAPVFVEPGVDLELVELTPAENARLSPRERPRLSQISGNPVGTRQGGVTAVGTLAVDANFSEFGDYLDRMLEAIRRQWHILAWGALPSGEVGTMVAVSFRIDSSGKVHDPTVEHSTAGLIATLICKDAITAREPFGPWSPEMREVLGEERTIRIRFFYR